MRKIIIVCLAIVVVVSGPLGAVQPADAFALIGDNTQYSDLLPYASPSFVVANPDNNTYLVGIFVPGQPSSVLVVESLTGQPVSTAVELQGVGITGFDAAYNATNKEYLVVARHSNYPSGDNGIYGQLLDVNGQPKGGRFLVYYESYSSSPVSLCWNSAENKYVAFWGHSTGYINGMVLNADGTLANLIGNVTAGLVGAGNPDVAYNVDANSYLLMFDAFFGIYGKLFDSAGNGVGPAFKVDDFAADMYSSPSFPKIDYHPGVHRYMVAWADKRDGEYPYMIPNIYAQVLNTDGTKFMGNFAISTLPENEFGAAVSSVPNSEKFLVSWIWDKSGFPYDQYVLAREVAATDLNPGPGVAISEEILVDEMPHAYVTSFVTAADCLDEQCLLAWTDERAGNQDIYGQRIGFPQPGLVVDIDIKPGNEQNFINISAEGVFPLAIFSSEEFDATQLIPESINLAGSAVKIPGNSHRYLCHYTDINYDGITDLLCQVDIAGLTPEAGTGRCRMTAMSQEETRLIVGEDFVTFK